FEAARGGSIPPGAISTAEGPARICPLVLLRGPIFPVTLRYMATKTWKRSPAGEAKHLTDDRKSLIVRYMIDEAEAEARAQRAAEAARRAAEEEARRAAEAAKRAAEEEAKRSAVEAKRAAEEEARRAAKEAKEAARADKQAKRAAEEQARSAAKEAKRAARAG